MRGVRSVRIGTFEAPEPALDDVLVRVKGVGICGSDLHYYLEGGIGEQRVGRGFVPGHEFAGEVVDGGGLAPGTLVAVDPAKPCGACEWCAGGDSNLCPNVAFIGAAPVHGAMREYIHVRPEQVFPVPDGFDVDTAVMLEPLGVAIHGVGLAGLRPAETVAVLGCGPIGLLTMQVARAAGASQIIAVDPLDYRLEVARRLGADAATAELDELFELTGGRGVDVVLEATDSRDAFEDAAVAARIGGRVVLIGIPDGDAYRLTASTARRKGLAVRFSRRMGHTYPRAIELVQSGKVDVKSIVTHRFPLADAAQAFELQAAREDAVLKSVVEPD